MTNFLIRQLAKILSGNRTKAIDGIIAAIKTVDPRNITGAAKLEFVRQVAVSVLNEKAGWLVDVIIHLLLAWVRRKEGAK